MVKEEGHVGVLGQAIDLVEQLETGERYGRVHSALLSDQIDILDDYQRRL